MQLKFNAGNFAVETWTDGYPMWTTLSYEGKEIARFHHNELPDLAFVIERHRNAVRGKLPEKDKHEVD